MIFNQSFSDSTAEPYLSVVVTTRNDDHGGDPLKRLQALVNSFDEQCRRTGLDAEVIIVEWNPPPEKPRVSSLLRLPIPSTCAYRFIEVPPQVHQRLKFADVLPLFQMIAKNVGIRRARGRFVVATNIDIIFSNELVELIASRQLKRGRLYRVDRHDIEPDVPVAATLEQQMQYCASHQLRVHARWGTSPVDADGRLTTLSEDIVDGSVVRLGPGWHVRESVAPGVFFRWAGEAATLLVDQTADGIAGDRVLNLDLESNPYDPASWFEMTVCEGAATLATTRVAGRVRLAVPLGAAGQAGPRPVELRVTGTDPDWQRQLPIYERRDSLVYRLYGAAVGRAPAQAPGSFAPTEIGAHPVRRREGTWKSTIADCLARLIAGLVGPGVRYRISRLVPEFQTLEQALRSSDEQVRALAPLRDVENIYRFLRERRPVHLHVNGCGDFQLMAREHWFDLLGYPEFETFSMNIDGLLSYIADAAGIAEQVLDMPIFHLEHEVGSGWSPEGEAVLRRRIAERGITWIDDSTVCVWAAYMKWLGRPMIFNRTDWGLVDAPVIEHSPAAPSGVDS